MDKRIIRTKESIKKAFMQLTLENELDKITVSDIAERAAINRSTFYLHYRDVASVTEDIDREFAEEISSCIDDFDLDDIYGSIYAMFDYLTSTLDNNETEKKYIIFSSDAGNELKRLKAILVEKTLAAIIETYPHKRKEDLEYPLTYAAAGIVESYVKWVRDEESVKSWDEVLRELSAYTEQIIQNLTKN